ncbi:MAG: hypothetical protein EZS28_025246 [Streblomastix strix]|uniref:Uncharacterized protein n=1 Tax=Streblomastix strix TaxID=222440 RepID=A0A5J4V9N1_9EUKA|nr:MAG: hypothetical protein EZS28_025246 [Streblomastix strix]
MSTIFDSFLIASFITKDEQESSTDRSDLQKYEPEVIYQFLASEYKIPDNFALFCFPEKVGYPKRMHYDDAFPLCLRANDDNRRHYFCIRFMSDEAVQQGYHNQPPLCFIFATPFFWDDHPQKWEFDLFFRPLLNAMMLDPSQPFPKPGFSFSLEIPLWDNSEFERKRDEMKQLINKQQQNEDQLNISNIQPFNSSNQISHKFTRPLDPQFFSLEYDITNLVTHFPSQTDLVTLLDWNALSILNWCTS